MSKIPFVLVTALVACGLARGSTISWNQWSANDAGSIATSAGTVGVSYTGEMSGFYTDYPSWTPVSSWADGSVVSNGPTGGTIVLTGGGGAGATLDTLTFSRPVVNPMFSIWSLGQPGLTASFHFAGVTPVLVAGGPNAEYGGQAITVSGHDVFGEEGNGTVEFVGTYRSISWVNPTHEFWYGLNVGVVGVVPEPPAVPLLLAGAGLLAFVRRRGATRR
jgi:hypothetical protein